MGLGPLDPYVLEHLRKEEMAGAEKR